VAQIALHDDGGPTEMATSTAKRLSK